MHDIIKEIVDITMYYMKNKKPPFEVANEMIGYVAGILKLVRKLSATPFLSINPVLQRSNRIKKIHGPLAIGQITLSLEQVTVVLNGKRVLTPPENIADVAI